MRPLTATSLANCHCCWPTEEFSWNTSPCQCVGCKRSMDSHTFQLASMTSLDIAITSSPETATVEEMNRRRCFKISTFTELSRGLFSADDLARIEQAILSPLARQPSYLHDFCAVASKHTATNSHTHTKITVHLFSCSPSLTSLFLSYVFRKSSSVI